MGSLAALLQAKAHPLHARLMAIRRCRNRRREALARPGCRQVLAHTRIMPRELPLGSDLFIGAPDARRSVRARGLENPRPMQPAPKACASTNSATPADCIAVVRDPMRNFGQDRATHGR